MLKASLGAAALMTALVSLACAQQWGAVSSNAEASADLRRAPSMRERTRVDVQVDAIITESHITRLRVALKLTPAQRPHWVPVEAALSELARQQARGEAAGFSHKFTDRGSAVALTAAQLRRLKVIAMPLIKTLDDNQKREAIAFARHIGFQQLVAAF